MYVFTYIPIWAHSLSVTTLWFILLAISALQMGTLRDRNVNMLSRFHNHQVSEPGHKYRSSSAKSPFLPIVLHCPSKQLNH